MRCVIFFLAALCLISFSCRNNSSKASAKVETLLENAANQSSVAAGSFVRDQLMERVDSIYSVVCKTYNIDDDNLNMYQFIVDQFCSQSWKDEEEKVYTAENRHPGEIGFLDYDIWVQGQDWDSISFNRVRIDRILSATRAIVTLAVHNERDRSVRLAMVKEQGQWMIDDFFDDFTPEGVKKKMTDYINEN